MLGKRLSFHLPSPPVRDQSAQETGCKFQSQGPHQRVALEEERGTVSVLSEAEANPTKAGFVGG
jgi:hypothetical protein